MVEPTDVDRVGRASAAAGPVGVAAAECACDAARLLTYLKHILNRL